MSCNTTASYWLQYPWIAPGVNEQPYLDPPTNTVKNIRTFSEWVTVLDLTGSILCDYMEDYPNWFVVTPSPGIVTSFTGADGDTRTGAVVADAGDYTAGMITGTGLVPGATVEDQLDYLLTGAGGGSAIVDSVQPTVPGSPVIGERVLLTSAPNQNSIATWDGLAWAYAPLIEGQSVVSKADDGYVYVMEGSGLASYRYDDYTLKASAADAAPGVLLDKLQIIGFTGAAIPSGGGEIARYTPSGGPSGGAVAIALYTCGATNTLPATGDWLDLTLGTAVQTSADVTPIGAEFEFQQTGTYFVGFKMTSADGANRCQSKVRLMMDAGGGFGELGGSIAYGYTPNDFNDLQSAYTGLIPVIAAVGDRIKAQGAVSSGVMPLTTNVDGTSIVIFRIQTAAGASTGDVVGPASSTDDSLARWDGITGKLLKDGLPYSTGGGASADAGKIVQFGAGGILYAGVDNTAIAAAVTGLSTHDTEPAIRGVALGLINDAIRGNATNGAGVFGTSVNGIGGTFGNDSAAQPALHAYNNDPAFTGDLAHFENATGQGLRVENDGGLQWTSPAGAQTTSDNLPVFGAADQGVVPASGGGTVNFLRADGAWATPADTDTGITELTGDVTAGPGSGSQAAAIANDAVTYAKMQNVSATDKILGRSSVGSGDVEEIDCTAAGRALLDDTSATDQRNTLGLGTASTANTGTGASDVPTITDADARYAPLYALSTLTYTGGSQVSTSTSYADVHSSATLTVAAAGTYDFAFSVAYDAAATTTGLGLGYTGPTQTNAWVTADLDALPGDKSSIAQISGDWGVTVPSSRATSGNYAILHGTITFTASGTLALRFKSEVAGSAVTITGCAGFIQRRY